MTNRSSSEIASAQSSIGSNGPEQSHPFMIEVAGGLLEMHGNADPLSGDCGLVFHACEPDITAVTAKCLCHHSHQLSVACRRFLDKYMQVLAFSGGVTPRDFLDLKVFSTNFDAPTDTLIEQPEVWAGVFNCELSDEIHGSPFSLPRARSLGCKENRLVQVMGAARSRLSISSRSSISASA